MTRFKTDLSWIVSGKLCEAVKSLITGVEVKNIDDGVDFTHTGGDGGRLCEIAARDNGNKEVVRLVVLAVDARKLTVLGVKQTKHDGRGFLTAVPGQWRITKNLADKTEETVWELFNCVIQDVDPIPF